MRWRGETATMRLQRITKWHRRLVWRPMQTQTGQWVWLEMAWFRYTVVGWQVCVGPDRPAEVLPVREIMQL